MKERLTVLPEEVRATLDARQEEEDRPSTRSEARRDRDRVLYSSAFLRLGHVTQVAAPEIGHVFHSRLTHSLKVAQVAAGLAQRLKSLSADGKLEENAAVVVGYLDEHATEAAALAHDLGHPPFGHLAESVLQKSATEVSFEGNPQSFRIVTHLALRSVARGLNLTRRTLNGVLKYPWLRDKEDPSKESKWGAYTSDRRAFEWAREGLPEDERTLEAHLMDWADDVTYAVHDMDDFYRAGLIPLDRLGSDDDELALFQNHLRRRYPEKGEELAEAARKRFAGFVSSIRAPYAGHTEQRVNLRALGSELIGRYIAAVELRDEDDHVVFTISEDIVNQVTVLKELTWFYIINRPALATIQRGQRKVVETLYGMYRGAIDEGDVSLFPPAFAEAVESAKTVAAKERVVIDLIAGMTEASAVEIYKQEIGVSSGSLLMRAAGPN